LFGVFLFLFVFVGVFFFLSFGVFVRATLFREKREKEKERKERFGRLFFAREDVVGVISAQDVK
jgi:hypothetical protein